MTPEELKARVDEVLIDRAGDDEWQHVLEDRLHLTLLEEYAPDWVLKELARMDDDAFSRWCA